MRPVFKVEGRGITPDPPRRLYSAFSCLLKMLASTQTATRPTSPSLPSCLVSATTFPVTSTGKNGAAVPNRSPAIIARQSNEIPRSHESFIHPRTDSIFSLITISLIVCCPRELRLDKLPTWQSIPHNYEVVSVYEWNISTVKEWQ